MAAQTAPRKLSSLGHDPIVIALVLGVAASTRIWSGALVMSDADGFAEPAAAGVGNGARIVHGVACETVDNRDGADGDLTVKVEKGTRDFGNSAGGDAITGAHVGQIAYAVDDQTVALTAGGGNRPAVGRIAQVDAQGRVFVEVGVHQALPQGPDQVLTAGADLRTHQFKFVKLTGGAVVLCGDGEAPYGVLQNAPNNTEPAIVRLDGATPLISSGAISRGAIVASDASGRAKAAVTGRVNTGDAGGANDPLIGSFAAAVLLADGAADTAAPALLRFTGTVPQTAA